MVASANAQSHLMILLAEVKCLGMALYLSGLATGCKVCRLH
jgi:hypothetical protein